VTSVSAANSRPLQALAIGSVLGALCFYGGVHIGGAGIDAPPRDGSTSVADTLLAALSSRDQQTCLAIKSLEGSIQDLQRVVDGLCAVRESAAPSPVSGQTQPAATQPSQPTSPLASEMDAQRLSALPRNPTDKGAVDRCLSTWEQEQQLLVYLTVEDVVARFGSPTRASAAGHFIEWTYNGSGPVQGRASAFVLRIVRSRVVQAIAMP